MKENYFVKNKLKKIAINKYLAKELRSAGFIDSEIYKTPLSTRITIYSSKPGFVIGKKGSNIRKLTENISEKFDFNKVHIEIGEVSNKNLDPKVVIEEISNDINRGVSWKSAVYRALRQIKKAGAVGAEIIAKGNTAGKGQRKRKSRYHFGYLKKAGDQKNLVGFEKKTTYPGLGTIGIRLRIVQPDTIFSDKIDVLEFAKQFKIKREEQILEEKEAKDNEEETKDKKEEAKDKDIETKDKAKPKPKTKKKETKPKASKETKDKDKEAKDKVKPKPKTKKKETKPKASKETTDKKEETTDKPKKEVKVKESDKPEVLKETKDNPKKEEKPIEKDASNDSKEKETK